MVVMKVRTAASGYLISLARRLNSLLLYVMWGAVRRELAFGPRYVLDVGCHEGDSMRLLRRRGRFVAIGVDIYEPALRAAKGRLTHNAYVLCDARQLPFATRSVDVILCMETLEHLSKADGLRVLSDIERIARRKVIISTPVGYLLTFASPAYDGNPYQIHLSGWSPQELRALGYQVYVGIFHRARRYFTEREATWAWMANIVMNSLLAPFTWLSPSLGSGMLCIKDLGETAR